MKKFIFLFVYAFLLTAVVNNCSSDSLYNSPSSDKQNGKAQFLQSQGFINFKIATPQNYILDTLFLKRDNDAKATIIICAGLCCSKESLAPFYALVPNNYNIVFFDARGHGKSTGSLFIKPWHYGIEEYKDILSVIHFVHQQTDTPIILYGNCAGAFNAAHALIFLAKHNYLASYSIKGFIFDSGWASRKQALRTALKAKATSILKRIIIKMLGEKYAKSTIVANALTTFQWYGNATLSLLHILLFSPLLDHAEATTNLYNKIGIIKLPILFIHSYDDTWVSIDKVKRLYANTVMPSAWWIREKSKHSRHFLIHKKMYQSILTSFCNKILP